ncbi:MAG TPA: copper resistance CopC family protein [Gemmatimonadales bacterium]|nr:copper resistance CopC family protein [Gemmatimonadales bacterium]
MSLRNGLGTGLRILPLAAVAVLSTAMFHNRLVKSTPGDGDTLAAAPSEIRLWFAERPEVAFTSVTLLREGPDSTRIGTLKGTVVPGDSLAVKLAVPVPLQAGGYVVAWRTASRDGHAIRGRFRFSVSP